MFMPQQNRLTLTGRIMVRRSWRGKYILQVEYSVQAFDCTPPPKCMRTGAQHIEWYERQKRGAPRLFWRDATARDVHLLGMGPGITAYPKPPAAPPPPERSGK